MNNNHNGQTSHLVRPTWRTAAKGTSFSTAESLRLQKGSSTPFSGLNIRRVKQLISKAAERKIIVLGDVMLDEFMWGSVRRISPEAPVPVVQLERESFMPGGAPHVGHNF